MGTFCTKKILNGSTSLIPTIATRIQEEMQSEGYEVAMDALSSGGYDISISKGGIFKAVLGMKTALKVTLLPQGNSISFDAGIGIFGKQIVPMLIAWYVTWPVLLTQIWGLVQQSKLDDRVLSIAEDVIANSEVASASSDGGQFCTVCGTMNAEFARFCSECGNSLK